MHHQTSPRARPLFAIFEGLAMMLSPKVGELAFEVEVSTQALAQPTVGVLGRRRAPRERRLGARKGACWTSVVGAREPPFLSHFLTATAAPHSDMNANDPAFWAANETA